MNMISAYTTQQEEFLRKILVLLSDDLSLVGLKKQFQNQTSMVLSTSFDDELLVDRISSRLKKENNFSILCDDHEFFVCQFGDDVGTVVFSVIHNKKQLTVNINL